MNYYQQGFVDKCAEFEIDPQVVLKFAGKDSPGVRDGTGPFKNSWQARMFGKGKQQTAGKPCPIKGKQEKVAQLISLIKVSR